MSPLTIFLGKLIAPLALLAQKQRTIEATANQFLPEVGQT
jgi:hypothetical protein